MLCWFWRAGTEKDTGKQATPVSSLKTSKTPTAQNPVELTPAPVSKLL